MTIFELFLTTFEASIVFDTAGAGAKIGLSLKLSHHYKFELAQIGETLCIILSHYLAHSFNAVHCVLMQLCCFH